MRGLVGRDALVIDEWALVRWGVEFVLRRSGFTRVFAVVTATQALTALRDGAARPALAVVGSVPDRSIAALTRALAVEYRCAVVVLLSPGDASHAVAVLRSGAQAVLEREARTVELREALSAVIEGRRHLSSGILGGPDPVVRVRGTRDVGVDPAPNRDLTPREREVLAGIAAGQSNRVIARRLSISEETVKTHITHLFQKLGVHARAQAVGVAVRQHLI